VGLRLPQLRKPLRGRLAQPAVWFPPLGLGLVLVAWLGPRAVALVLADALLVQVQACVEGAPNGWAQACGEILLSGAEVWIVWWCYHRLMKGCGGFTDPRSTIR